MKFRRKLKLCFLGGALPEEDELLNSYQSAQELGDEAWGPLDAGDSSECQLQSTSSNSSVFGCEVCANSVVVVNRVSVQEKTYATAAGLSYGVLQPQTIDPFHSSLCSELQWHLMEYATYVSYIFELLSELKERKRRLK